MNNLYFEELESLRGLAALLVVFNHFLQFSHQVIYVPLVMNGYLMVDLFFVISGFVINNAYSERINCSKDFVRFFLLRLGRLYPVHILFLFLFVLIEILKLIFVPENIASLAFTKNGVIEFVENLFLVHGVIQNGNFSYNIPSWSISVELITYIVFGITIFLLKSRSSLLFPVAAIVAIYILFSHETYGFTNLLRCFAGFFLGCTVAQSNRKFRITLPANISLVIFIALILFLMFKRNSTDLDIIIYPLSAILIASLVLRPRDLLNQLLKLNFLRRLGAMSYSIYMSHFFLLWCVDNFFKRILSRGQNIDGMRNVTVAESWVTLFVFISLVLVISWQVFLYVEQPLRAASRRMVLAKQ